MKLLITTQSLDRNDPILGFFHRWTIELARHFEHIHVICLRKGEYDLPPNVSVYSLGKEAGESRLKYIWNFCAALYALRGKYDRVFSHMNPHYIVLAGIYWKLSGVSMFLWRNHARMNFMTRIAALFAKKIFYTSPYACTARYAHAVQMPVGIDTDLFSPVSVRDVGETKKILSLGRLSPVKKIDMLVEAAKLLPEAYEIHIYGEAPQKDSAYKESLQSNAGGNVRFHPSIRNDQAAPVYAAHDLFVNLTPNGSMDKTVLEAAACGTDVVVANESFRDVLGEDALLLVPTPETLREKIVERLALKDEEKREILETRRKNIIESHSLAQLGKRLTSHIYGTN